MKFCPQCGKELVPGNRFCEECGYDLLQESSPAVESTTITPPVPPAAEPHVQPPVLPTPAATAQGKPHVTVPGSPAGTKSSKLFLWIFLGILGVAVIVTGGWFGYTKFLKEKTTESPAADSSTISGKSNPADTGKALIAAQQSLDSSKTTGATVATPGKSSSAQPVKGAQADKGKTTSTGKNLSGANQQAAAAKPGKSSSSFVVKSTAMPPGKTLKTLFSSLNRENPRYKNPKSPTRFSLTKTVMIVRVITDHFNENKGTASAGTITILDKSKKVVGTFKATGKSGSNGANNGKWVAEPKIILQPGTYYIQDSDPSTWSKNFFGNGFTEVEGYEL